MLFICPNDNFNIENSHFISAIIRKIMQAKEIKKTKVYCWGSGDPRREFIQIDDAADGIKYLIVNNLS